MDFSSTSCVFLGYSTFHHGYRCFDPQIEQLYIVRHVRFNEHSFPFTKTATSLDTSLFTKPYYSSYPTLPPLIPNQEHSSISISTNLISHSPSSFLPPAPSPTHTYVRQSQDHVTTFSFDRYTQAQPPPSSTIPQPSTEPLPPFDFPNMVNIPTNNQSNSTTTSITTYTSSFHIQPSTSNKEPTLFTIANKHPQWCQAIAGEYSSLLRNSTWSLVLRVPNTNMVDFKWVYKVEHDQTGFVTHYKARLVEKGFRK